jgi:hypothetical protein
MDHYRCDLHYIPETRGYQVSGSMELFAQRCQLPDMTPHQNFRALTNELTADMEGASTTPKGRQIIKQLQDCIIVLLTPPPTHEEQWVDDG